VHRHPVQETRGLAFNHDGTRLVAGSDDGLLRIYEVQSQQLLGILSPAPRFLRDIIWAPSRDRIVAAGRDHWIRGWDSANGEMRFERNDSGAVEGLAASGDGSQFASCSPHHEALGVVWNREGVPVSTWSRPDYGSSDIALSPNGKWLALVPTLPAKSHMVELTELATGRVQQLIGTQGRAYARPAFSPDNRYLAAGANTQEIRLWQTSDWQTASMISLPGGNVCDLLWTSDSQRLLIGVAGKEIVELDATQSPPVEFKRYPAPGLARCALSPDGSTR
jgi:WD40 repeat protein